MQNATLDAIASQVTVLQCALRKLPHVKNVSATWHNERSLFIGVVVDEFDWDSRTQAIELIDDFHRANVDRLSVDFRIVDPEHAAHANC